MKTKFYTFAIAFLMINTINANSCEYIAMFDLSSNPQELTPPLPSAISKVLVKTFALKGQSTVIIDFDGEVEIKEWSENTMRVHTDITLHNSSTHMLKYLMTQGRYQLNLEDTDKGILIDATARAKKVIISKDGTTLNESVKYTIFVPKNTEVINLATTKVTHANQLRSN